MAGHRPFHQTPQQQPQPPQQHIQQSQAHQLQQQKTINKNQSFDFSNATNLAPGMHPHSRPASTTADFYSSSTTAAATSEVVLRFALR